MLYKHYNKVFNIILSIILLLSSVTYANTNENLYSKNSNIVVGLLKIEEEIYQYELGLSKKFYEIFNNFGVKTILIDYIKIINLKKIKVELAKQDEVLPKKLILDLIKIELVKFIKEHKINRIFIPGNYKDLYLEPFSPCRQLIIEAILKIVDDHPSIHLLVICGGLHDIMNVKGIEIINVENLMNNEEKRKSYLKSSPNSQKEDVPLQQIKIIPNSHLAKIVSKFLLPDKNGWFSTYFPNAHSRAVSNTTENRRKLELLEYKIAALSDNGLIIEAIEDKHGNIYFRSYLEALSIKSNKNLYLSNRKVYQISTLVAMAIINDFLYRNLYKT